MFSLKKRFTAIFMTLVMVAGISTTAFAAETSINVQLNGSNIAFDSAKPLMKNDRVYVPFRSVFEAMGAEVSYIDATKTISAKKANDTVTFTVGNADIALTNADGTKETVKSDAPSFSQGGSVYVPLRFAAQAFGYKVGWDDTAQTAIIADMTTLLSQLDGKFTTMDKYMAYSQSLSNDSFKFTGTFNMSMSMLTDETLKDSPIKLTGDMSGITSTDKLNMDMAIKLDMTTLTAMLAKQGLTVEELATATKELDAFKDMKMSIIFDMTSLKYYISSPMFAQAGLDADAWYLIDYNELLTQIGGVDASLMSFDSILELAKSATFVEYIKGITESIPLTSISDYSSMQELIDMCINLLGDSAFKKENDTYISNYTTGSAVKINFNMKITEKDNKITASSVDLSMTDATAMSMAMSVVQDGLNSKVKMSMNMKDLLSFLFDANMDMVKTTETPISVPKAGSKIIPFNEMF